MATEPESDADQIALSETIKKTHSLLRNSARHDNANIKNVWKSHKSDAEKLQKYAAAMEKLSELWNKSHPCSDNRVEWCRKVSKEYFENGGKEKSMEKEQKTVYYKLLENGETSETTFEEFYAKRMSNCGVIQRKKTNDQPLKLLDVGSCFNPFKKFQDEFDVLAIDLCPAPSTAKGKAKEITRCVVTPIPYEDKAPRKLVVMSGVGKTPGLPATTSDKYRISETLLIPEGVYKADFLELDVKDLDFDNSRNVSLEKSCQTGYSKTTNDTPTKQGTKTQVNKDISREDEEEIIDSLLCTNNNTDPTNEDSPHGWEERKENAHETGSGELNVDDFDRENQGLPHVPAENSPQRLSDMADDFERPDRDLLPGSEEWMHRIRPGEDRIYDVEKISTDTIVEKLNLDLTKEITELPAKLFDIVVFSLLLSYFPTPKLRWDCCVKASKLLTAQGLLLVIESDSASQNRNSHQIKSWKQALAGIGLVRYKYEKLAHLHCLAFRKSLDVKQAPNNAEMMFIPQDFHDESDQSEELKIEPRDEATNREISELFENLPEFEEI